MIGQTNKLQLYITHLITGVSEQNVDMRRIEKLGLSWNEMGRGGGVKSNGILIIMIGINSGFSST